MSIQLIKCLIVELEKEFKEEGYTFNEAISEFGPYILVSNGNKTCPIYSLMGVACFFYEHTRLLG